MPEIPTINAQRVMMAPPAVMIITGGVAMTAFFQAVSALVPINVKFHSATGGIKLCSESKTSAFY